jgi:hypothetical protein
MTRNYNTLKTLVKDNKNNCASFKCMKCLLEFYDYYLFIKQTSIQFYLDDATRLPNAAQVSILFGSDFYGTIKSLELKRENTTAIVDFDSRYSSVLDTKLLINGELYYHWRIMTNGYYDQQVYWEIEKD